MCYISGTSEKLAQCLKSGTENWIIKATPQGRGSTGDGSLYDTYGNIRHQDHGSDAINYTYMLNYISR